MKCADCKNHTCTNLCLRHPKNLCDGKCINRKHNNCYASRTCKSFNQVDWQGAKVFLISEKEEIGRSPNA